MTNYQKAWAKKRKIKKYLLELIWRGRITMKPEFVLLIKMEK